MYVKERFVLNEETVNQLQSMQPKFGYNGLGEFLFYKNYSRLKADGKNESWADCIIRVTEGTFSIRKDHYIRNRIPWDEGVWQHYALHFAISMFKMEWLPPGRGLWIMGSDFMYERGGMALYNCASVEIKDLAEDAYWIMDCLMNGVGVGFSPTREDDLKAYPPINQIKHFRIADSREGWCESVAHLITSYLEPGSPTIQFNYDDIRPLGQPIKGFGGVASGPDPLIQLHKEIRLFFQYYMEEEWFDSVILKTDIANTIGKCVVSGNIRRSAEIAILDINDPVFKDLKDYEKYPHRWGHGWLSNNSVIVEDDQDFENLDEIAKRVVKQGEPGLLNLRNFKYGRIGKDDHLLYGKDLGRLTNPCGEIILESHEVCNLAITCPTMCENGETWLKACEYACAYCSTVSLLPTHSDKTNAIVARNRRIGVSISDISGWKHKIGANQVIKYLRKGYQRVRSTNTWLNGEAGIPRSIRVTTVKPDGSVVKLPGITSGMMWPSFHYTLRRVRVSKVDKLHSLLVSAGIPYEPDVNEPTITDVFEFPILQGPARVEAKVSLWEQAMTLSMLQREWSDNMISNTLKFQQHEIDDIESVLSMLAPLTKSISLLPHTEEGVYAQMPESGITKEEYEDRLSKIKPIDWSQLSGHKAQGEAYCTSERCNL